MQIVCGCGNPIRGKPRRHGDCTFYRYVCKCGAQYRLKPPRAVLFLAISGSHAYGFARPDSDIDWRGVFLQRPEQIIALRPDSDTIVRSKPDLTLYSLLRWGRLLIEGNGNVLENLFQPKAAEHRAVKQLQKIVLRDIVSKAFYGHYRGYAWQCWLQRHSALKWPLHAVRLLLTGINLLESGHVETNLLELNRKFKIDLIDKMISVYRSGGGIVKAREIEQLTELFNVLETARRSSQLCQEPDIDRLNRFIYELYKDPDRSPACRRTQQRSA